AAPPGERDFFITVSLAAGLAVGALVHRRLAPELVLADEAVVAVERGGDRLDAANRHARHALGQIDDQLRLALDDLAGQLFSGAARGPLGPVLVPPGSDHPRHHAAEDELRRRLAVAGDVEVGVEPPD